MLGIPILSRRPPTTIGGHVRIAVQLDLAQPGSSQILDPAELRLVVVDATWCVSRHIVVTNQRGRVHGAGTASGRLPADAQTATPGIAIIDPAWCVADRNPCPASPQIIGDCGPRRVAERLVTPV